MAVTSQSALKELIDETTVIKNDLVSCRDSLKNNLSAKGVDVSDVYKLNELISKVHHNLMNRLSYPTWYIENMEQHNIWITSSASMPDNQYASPDYVSVCKHGVYIYAVLTSPYSSSDTGKINIMKYNTNTNKWTQLKQQIPYLNSRINSFSSNKETVSNKIYFIGGYNYNTNQGINQNVCYDVELDVWTERTAYPENVCNADCCVAGEKIHVFGGDATGNSRARNSHRIYDTVLNVWIDKAPMLKAKKNLGVVKVNNMIHSFGGQEGGGGKYFNDHDCYDLDLDVWTTKPLLPYTAMGVTATVVKNMIYLFGGYSYGINANYFNYVYSYDTIKNEYKNLRSMVKNRYVGTAISYEELGHIYYLSGHKMVTEDSSPYGINYLYII